MKLPFSEHFQDKTWNFELKAKTQYSKDHECANATHKL